MTAVPHQPDRRCSECGALLQDAASCVSLMHQLLALEDAALAGEGGAWQMAHFLAIGSYRLQHPSQLTQPAAALLREVFYEALRGRTTIDRIRRRVRSELQRAREDRQGLEENALLLCEPRWPKSWAMTVSDVLVGGRDAYLERVRAWAGSVDDALIAALGRPCVVEELPRRFPPNAG